MNLHFRITDYCNIKCLNCWSLSNNNSLHMNPELVKKYILNQPKQNKYQRGYRKIPAINV